MAVDSGGNVYVADTLGNRIQEFRPGGALLGEVVGEGPGPGQVSFPVGIDLDRAAASLYVADAGNARIEKFHLPVPVLTVPADLTVNATSPAGAVVSYTATATDQTDPSPVVACSPPSGSTFAIGDSVVGCTATNDSGGTAEASFNVYVKDAGAQLGDLLAKLKGYGLTPKGAEQSLAVKLNAALAGLASSDNAAACSALQSFLAEVAAQRGKKLTVAQADSLTADARRICSVLGC